MKTVLFSDEELKILEGKGWACDHGVPSIHIHFGWDILDKYEDGSIVENYACPTNVDPDDASYDMSYTTYYYDSFKDFIDGKMGRDSVRRVE